MKRAYKLQEFVAHASNVNCLKIGKKSSRVLVTGGEDHKVNMWAIGKPNTILSLSGHSSAVESVTFDAAEALVVAGAASGTIKLWDLEEAKVVRTLTGHRSNCIAVDFHPFGEFFASGSLDTNLKIWDIRRKGCIHTYKGHTRGVNCIKFSPDGRWIVSGGEDNTVKLWDLTAGKLMHDFKYHEGQVQCLDFHPHEFLLATGSADRTTKFYDLETFELIGSAGPESSGIRSMIFNPDGRTLLCAMQESLKVLSWEPLRCHDAVDASWSKIADLCVHEGKLLGCSFNQSCVGIWVVDLTRAGRLQESNTSRSSGSFSERQSSNGNQTTQSLVNESLKSCLARSGLPNGFASSLKDLKFSSGKDTENISNTQQRASTPVGCRGISSSSSISSPFVLTPRKGGAARVPQCSEAKVPPANEGHSPRQNRPDLMPEAVAFERKASITRLQQGGAARNPQSTEVRNPPSSDVQSPKRINVQSIPDAVLERKASFTRLQQGAAARISQSSDTKFTPSSEIHSPRQSQSESIRDGGVLDRKTTVSRPQQGGETHSPLPSCVESVSVAAVVRSIETLSTSNRSDTVLNNNLKHTIGLGRSSETAVEESSLMKGPKSYGVQKFEDDTSATCVRSGDGNDSMSIAARCREFPTSSSTNLTRVDKTDRPQLLRSTSFSARVEDGESGLVNALGKSSRPDVQDSLFSKHSHAMNDFTDATSVSQGQKLNFTEKNRRDVLHAVQAVRPTVQVSRVEREKASFAEGSAVNHASGQKTCFDLNASVPRPDQVFTKDVMLTEESESDVLHELMRYHNVVSSALQSRLAKLQVVRRFWMKNDVKAALEATRKMGDNSVLVDFLSIIVDRSDLLTLEICAILLPSLNGLLLTDFERHLKTALSVLTMLLKTFGPVIHSSLSSSPSFGVDLQAEQRYERCSMCFKELQAAKQSLALLSRRGGEISKAAECLMASLENL